MPWFRHSGARAVWSLYGCSSFYTSFPSLPVPYRVAKGGGGRLNDMTVLVCVFLGLRSACVIDLAGIRKVLAKTPSCSNARASLPELSTLILASLGRWSSFSSFPVYNLRLDVALRCQDSLPLGSVLTCSSSPRALFSSPSLVSGRRRTSCSTWSFYHSI
jgi:hypothetical protein